MRIKSKKFAYVHIDMNAAEPEMAAIDFFWDKLNPGGIILLCDYNIFGQKEQRYAWNAWAKSKGVSILALPTTQGMILKPNGGAINFTGPIPVGRVTVKKLDDELLNKRLRIDDTGKETFKVEVYDRADDAVVLATKTKTIDTD